MVDKVSADAQGRPVHIGDTVFSMAKNYRSLVEAKVIDITPKTLLVEYVNNWNYSRGVVERYRVGSDQIMLKWPKDVPLLSELNKIAPLPWRIQDDGLDGYIVAANGRKIFGGECNEGYIGENDVYANALIELLDYLWSEVKA